MGGDCSVKKKKTDLLFLFPSLAGMLLFFVVPFGACLYYACTDNAFSGKFAGGTNFRALLNNEFFRLAAANTVKFLLCAVPAAVVGSFLLALLLARFGKRLTVLRSAFFLPVMLPSAAVVLFWNAYCTRCAEELPFFSLVVLFLWKYAGLDVMLFLTALTGVDRDTLDAARIDGASPVRVVVSVLLPQITPTLFFVLILTVTNALRIHRESYLLYGSYPSEDVYMLGNYLGNHFAKLNYQNIGAAAVMTAAVMAVGTALLWHLGRRETGS